MPIVEINVVLNVSSENLEFVSTHTARVMIKSPEKNTRFAHTRVANEEQFEKQIWLRDSLLFTTRVFNKSHIARIFWLNQ